MNNAMSCLVLLFALSAALVLAIPHRSELVKQAEKPAAAAEWKP